MSVGKSGLPVFHFCNEVYICNFRWHFFLLNLPFLFFLGQWVFKKEQTVRVIMSSL